MFKTYLNTYHKDFDATDEKSIAYELAALDTAYRVAVSESGKYYINDGIRWFGVNERDYVEPIESLAVDNRPSLAAHAQLRVVSMRDYAIHVGTRKVAPIYNFTTRTISFIGVNFETTSDTVILHDSGVDRTFAYGINGSEFFFIEI